VRFCLVAALLVWAAPAAAQRARVRLDIRPPASDSVGPVLTSANLLADSKTRELLRNSFPAKLHYRVELWREARWFDDPAGSTEWDAFVSYDPVMQVYRVLRQRGRQTEDFGGFATLTSAEAPLDRAFVVPLRPRRSGKYYYTVKLDIETLSESDLDALQRWLSGEAQPAVHGKTNPATAIGNGVETLLSRILGGEKLHYEERSPTFRVR
jgi:hypothetical protein